MNLNSMTTVDNDVDKEFFEGLYRLYYPLMKQKAYSIIRNYEVIDDLIQDAFMKLIINIPLLQTLSSRKTISYIVCTIKHVCIDYIRQRTRRSQYVISGSCNDITDQIPDMHAEIEENYMKTEEIEEMEQTLVRLPRRDRSLLFLKYYMELCDKEIEGLTNIPAQHVRQYISRARRKALRLISEGKNLRHRC